MIKAVSGAVLNMIDAVYDDKPLILIRDYVFGEARLPSLDNEYKLLDMFAFIKAVSDAVLDMIDAVYHDKHLILIRDYVLGEVRLPSLDNEYKLLDMFEFIKAVSDTLLGTINGAYHDKPWIILLYQSYVPLPFGTDSLIRLERVTV